MLVISPANPDSLLGSVSPCTLAIDIGTTTLKAAVLGRDGSARSERVRVTMPDPATPSSVLHALWTMIEPLGEFDRVSVGFPGVVVDGVTRTAPALDEEWRSFDLGRALAEAFQRPVRVLDHAALRGHGVIRGRGIEQVLTLGTTFGCAVYLDGRCVPNLALARHPFRNGKTYEQYVGSRTLDRIGKAKWNKRVRDVICQVMAIWNPDRLYLRGRNAKHVKIELPANVTIATGTGMAGGLALWRDGQYASS